MAFILILALAILWTPDTSRPAMMTKYMSNASKFLSLEDGSRVHYRDQGNKYGFPLVFIHGTSASLHIWEPLISELDEQHFRFISFDLPGHGLSGANVQRDYSHAVMVKAVWELLEHLNVASATMVGSSFGGAVAWHATLDSPQRVASLILLAPSGVPSDIEPRSNIGFKLLKNPIGQALMRKITPRAIIKASLEQTVFDAQLVDDVMVDRYWELLRYPGNRQAMLDLSKVSRQTDAWLKMAEIKQASLIIWGEQDSILPVDMAEKFVAKLPNVRLLKLDRVGHLPMEEQTSIVAQALSEFCVDSCTK